MVKTFCDRCGKEIKKIDHVSVYAWLTHKCYYATLRHVGQSSESDEKYICPECEQSYIHWFMNPENQDM